jgi:hypothetical protein
LLKNKGVRGFGEPYEGWNYSGEPPTGATPQPPSSAAPPIPPEFVGKPYAGVEPGTPQWMDIWKSSPELQPEMLKYKKQIAGAATAAVIYQFLPDDMKEKYGAGLFMIGQISPKYAEVLKAIKDPHIKAALEMQKKIDKVVKGGRTELAQNPKLQFISDNMEYGLNIEPDRLCQRSIGCDLGVKKLKDVLGKEYTQEMGYELINRAQLKGLQVACPECFTNAGRTGNLMTQKQIILGEAGYAEEMANLIAKQHDKYGLSALRGYSNSDLKPTHLPGWITTLRDAQKNNLPIGMYTKTTYGPDILAPAGVHVNMSVSMDDLTGMNRDIAVQKRAENPTVGIIDVTFTDAQTRAAKANNQTDHVIGWHRSGKAKARLANEIGVPEDQIIDHTDYQSDSVVKQQKNNTWQIRPAPKERVVQDWEHGGDLSKYLAKAEENNIIPRFLQYMSDDPAFVNGVMNIRKYLLDNHASNYSPIYDFIRANTEKLDPNYMKLVGPEYGKHPLLGGEYPYKPPDLSKVNISLAQQVLDDYLRDPNSLIPRKEDYMAIADEMIAKYKGKPSLNYQGSHKPMTVEGGASRLHDLTNGTFDETIYGKDALQNWGTGADMMDRQTLSVFRQVRGKPDADITVYRAVPKGVKESKLSDGDWVTVNRNYAIEHGEGILEGNYKIISQKVKVKDLTTSADSINEQGYHPLGKPSLELKKKSEVMGININDDAQPFTEQILSGEKTIETRDSPSLRPYVGKQVGIVRTGKGKQAELVGYATVADEITYQTKYDFMKDVDKHLVGEESPYSFKDKKYGYVLEDIQRIKPQPITTKGNVARKVPLLGLNK